MSESSAVVKGWVCPECTVRTRKGDNTPVRQTVSAAIATTKNDTLRAPVQSGSPGIPRVEEEPAVLLNVHEVHQELAEWIQEMREFRREMTEFRSSILGLSKRMDLIEQRLETVEQEREAPSTELADLQRKVVLLQQEVDERDQDALLSDLEIGHFPEAKGENVIHSVSILAAKLGVALEERDIVFAERAGIAQVTGPGGEMPRPRRIVVRLARRHLRDQLLQAARVRRTLTLSDGDLNPSTIAGATAPPRTRIFLNERLTRTNRQLFHRVREECRKHQWRFSWTTRGKIFARQAEGKERFLFRSKEEVGRVFGTEPV